MDTIRQHFTGSSKIFIGYAIINDRINPSIYFQLKFFLHVFSIRKTINKCFLPISLVMECDITDEEDVDGLFPSVM